jgi:UDP-2,4-diacetamido-2,4,6-trideoxy-beta-L-altropyranose hydrolase
VVGGSNPHFTRLQKTAAQSPVRITVRRDVSNMAELMAAADAAISAAGSTCWELCLLGLPALLADVAHNQTALARELHRRGCAIHVGDRTVPVEKIADQMERLLRSYELRQSLSQRSRELVDGNGSRRAVSVLRGAAHLRLRRARTDDSSLLWKWANDPEVRAASFSSDPISWETHAAWFAEKLGQDKSLIWIAEDEVETPFGQIRFDLNPGGEAELHISLVKEKRGCGLAVPLIEAGVRKAFSSANCERVHAFVKPWNAASIRAFERVGFVRAGLVQVREQHAVHYICARD